FENTDSERSLLAQQDAWVAQQHHEQYAAPATGAVGATGAETPAAQPAPAAQRDQEQTAANPFVAAAAEANASADTSPTSRLGQPV
ncbi:hypothetical protein SB767_28635, partial [Bacillus sp. SIMBA_069]